MRTLSLALFIAGVTLAQDTGAISGRVVSLTGQPLAKAIVNLQQSARTPQQTGLRSFDAATDADGQFQFTGLAPSSYMLSAEHPGYVPTSYSSSKSGGAFTLLNVAQGQRIDGLSIAMPRQSSIAGTIFDDDGDPAPRAQVRALIWSYAWGGKRHYSSAADVFSDENGQFRIANLKSGKYLLAVAPPASPIFGLRRAAAERQKPEELFVDTFYPGVPALASAVPLDIAPGQDAAIVLRLAKKPVFHVRGTVSGPVPTTSANDVRVYAFEESLGVLSSERFSSIARDGSFDIAGVSAGSYRIVLGRMQGMRQTFGAAAVQVSNQDVNNVALEARLISNVTGVIRLEGNSSAGPAAATHFRISLRTAGTSGLEFSMGAVVRSDGAFGFVKMNPDSYQIVVSGMPQGGYVKSVRLGGIDLTNSLLDLTHGSPAPLEITVSTQGGQLSGTVKDREGRPLSAAVSLIPRNASEARPDLNMEAQSGDDGQFSFTGIAPGRYRIYAWDRLERGQQYDPDFMRLHEGEGQSVTIEENSKQQIALAR